MQLDEFYSTTKESYRQLEWFRRYTELIKSKIRQNLELFDFKQVSALRTNIKCIFLKSLLKELSKNVKVETVA